MQDKKTYPIDENALREKFANYNISFNSSSLDFLDDEMAQVKTHKPIELPETKNILKFIAIPVAVVVVGCVMYFGYSYIKKTNSAATPKDTTTVVKNVVKPKEEVVITTPSVEVANTPTVAVKAEIKKQVTPVTPVPQKIKNTVKTSVPEPVAVPKKDTTPITTLVTIPVADTVGKKSKADMAAGKEKENTAKKKKKKRKNSLDVTDDIRQSTQKPNSADDDVVVPDN
jgi:hypothetical protein